MSEISSSDKEDERPYSKLEKQMSDSSSCSVQSFNSEDLIEEDPTYEEAPHDLFSDTVELGRILVLKKGEKVPCRTKYKSKKGGDCFIRFR